MNRLFSFIILAFGLLTSSSASAQNLVPNGSFERNGGTPENFGEWFHCPPWSNTNKSEGSTGGTPDYLHADGVGSAQTPNTVFGYCDPVDGDAAMGLCLYHLESENFREYLSVELTEPLRPGNSYTFSFYFGFAEPGDIGNHCSQDLGVHFSNGPLMQELQLPILVEPQLVVDSVRCDSGWQYYEMTFTVDTICTHLTLGNFFDDDHSNVEEMSYDEDPSFPSCYVFIDMVSIVPKKRSGVVRIG